MLTEQMSTALGLLSFGIVVYVAIKWSDITNFKMSVYKERLDEFKRNNPNIIVIDHGGISDHIVISTDENGRTTYELFASEWKSEKEAKLLQSSGHTVKRTLRRHDGRLG